MTIDFQCERCGQAYRVDDDKAGLKLRCQVCGIITPIPARQAVTVDSVTGGGDDEFEEPYRDRRAQRPPNLSRSGRLKSSSKKKKSNGNAIALAAAGVALVVVAAGIFLAVRALRRSGDESVAEKSTQEGAPRSKGRRSRTQTPANSSESAAAETAPVEEAKKVIAPSERLKQIGEAFFKYQEVKRTLPMPALQNSDGAQLLSWRVELLPFLGENKLFRQFKLDEPWDSENNKPLIDKIPSVYVSPGSARDGKTRVMVFTGPGTLFKPGATSKLSDISDNPATTLLAIEALPSRAAVEWTKPADLEYKGYISRSEVGNRFGESEGIQALMADGNVVVLNESIPSGTFQALVTIAAHDEPPQLAESIIAGAIRTATDKAPAPAATNPEPKASATNPEPKAAATNADPKAAATNQDSKTSPPPK